MIFLSVLLLICVIVFIIGLNMCYDGDCLTFPSCAIGIVCIISFMLAPITRLSDISNINQLEATRQTVERYRNNKSVNQLELAAMQAKVIECNQWLYNAQYWKKTQWGLWISDKVIGVKPIE